MSTVHARLSHLWQHLGGLQRLVWMPAPTLGRRCQAAVEYVRLSRLQRRLLTPGGLARALTGVLAATPAPHVAVPLDALQDALAPLAAAVRVHPTALCLAQALRLLGILHAAGWSGAQVCLKVGVRRAARGFRGHAWVEYAGTPLLDQTIAEGTFEAVWYGHELLAALRPSGRPAAPYRVCEGVVARLLAADEAILLNLADGLCYALNGSGHLIWSSVVRTGTLAESIQLLVRQSGEDPRAVEAEVEAFVQGLVSAGLVRAV